MTHETTKVPCPKCGGSGFVLDDRTVGAIVRAARARADLSLRDAAERLGWSAAYLCDLELGRRAWNAERVERVRRRLHLAIGEIV